MEELGAIFQEEYLPGGSGESLLGTTPVRSGTTAQAQDREVHTGWPAAPNPGNKDKQASDAHNRDGLCLLPRSGYILMISNKQKGTH